MPPPGVEPDMPLGHGVTARFPPQGIVGKNSTDQGRSRTSAIKPPRGWSVELRSKGRNRTYIALVNSQPPYLSATLEWRAGAHLAGSPPVDAGADSHLSPASAYPPLLGEKESNPRRRDSKSRLDTSNHLQRGTVPSARCEPRSAPTFGRH